MSREQLAYGVYFGCVLMLLVWSGLVFVAVRDQAFLAYFAYVASFGMYMMVNTGFAFQYLWPDSPALGQYLPDRAAEPRTDHGAAFLDHHPALARLHAAHVPRGASDCRCIGCLASRWSPFMEYAMLVRPVTFLILASVIFMIVLGIVSLLAGSRPARYYVIAWGAFLAGSVVFLLKNFGLVPHTFMSQHSWQVGALLEMILLSMTLSSRMTELKHQSRTDPLTLLGNRRLFDDRLPIEFAQRAAGKPAAVVAGASTSTISRPITTNTATRSETRRSNWWARRCGVTHASRCSPVATAVTSSA